MANTPVAFFGNGKITQDNFASTFKTPKDIDNCVLWLDSTDLTTITKDGSNNVSAWNDKSGYANHATNSGTYAYPTYSASGILFKSGTPNPALRVTASTSLNFTTSFTCIVACNVTDALQGGWFFYRGASSAVTAQYGFIHQANGSSPCGYGMYINGSIVAPTGTANLTTGDQITSWSWDQSVIRTRNKHQRRADVSFSTALTTRDNVFIGARSNAADGSSVAFSFYGYIREIIAYSSALPMYQIASIETYLKNKYSL